MTDEIDPSLLTVEGSPSAARPAASALEQEAQDVMDACADFFTELSLMLRKLASDLPPHLKAWLPQIAGGAMHGQVLVAIEGLLKLEDQKSCDMLLMMGQRIASRVNEAIAQRDQRDHLD